MFFTPKARNSGGMDMAPVELTASRMMEKLALAMASLSTKGSCRMASIWSWMAFPYTLYAPNFFTSAYANSWRLATDCRRSPSSPEMNSPLALSSFRAFHCMGLCEAVTMTPPSA